MHVENICNTNLNSVIALSVSSFSVDFRVLCLIIIIIIIIIAHIATASDAAIWPRWRTRGDLIKLLELYTGVSVTNTVYSVHNSGTSTQLSQC